MNYCTKEQLIAFEDRIKTLWEEGELPYLIHLCGGNETALIDIFGEINEGDWIFSSHRAHYHALLSGIPESKVEEFIRRGDSMFIFDKKRRFVSSAVLAGTCCIASGVARAIKDAGGTERVWCFIGDGAEDNGHFHEAVMYVSGHELPCTFVIEDNNMQVDTPKVDRRGPYFHYDPKNHSSVYSFDPVWPSCVRRYQYTRVFPHAGSGCSHHIQFKRTTPLP